MSIQRLNQQEVSDLFDLASFDTPASWPGGACATAIRFEMSTRATSTALDSDHTGYLNQRSGRHTSYQSFSSRLQETNRVTENGFNSGEPQEQNQTPRSYSLPFHTQEESDQFDTSKPPTPSSYLLAHSAMSTGEGLAEVLADWSGRGTHVDFQKDEVVPLNQGRFLGHGSMGSVFETTVRGHVFAWKKRFCRRKIDAAEMKEIEILKKLSHGHIIKIAGSYTHGKFLGLLLYPAATCDLATFFEDAEALFNNHVWDSVQEERFEALGLHRIQGQSRYPVELNTRVFISSRMGCIISAVEYLHGQKIRHKDLKPSNILLAAQGLWLTDFGTATDFSNQTVSTTDNCERGTPKYFAPEMAAFDKCGRSADIFSLGCVLLEMYTLKQGQTLEVLRKLRPRNDKSYQSNLDKIHQWLSRSTGHEDPGNIQIRNQIQYMLAREPTDRPTINNIQTTFALFDAVLQQSSKVSLFNKCCRGLFVSRDDHEREMNIARQNAADTVSIAMQKDIDRLRKENDNLLAHIDELQGKVDQQVQNLNGGIQPYAPHRRKSDATNDNLIDFIRSNPRPYVNSSNSDDGSMRLSSYKYDKKRSVFSSAKGVLGLARNDTKTKTKKKNITSSVPVVASEVRDTVSPIRSLLKDPDVISDGVSNDSADQLKIETSRQSSQYVASSNVAKYVCVKCGLQGDNAWLWQHYEVCENPTQRPTVRCPGCGRWFSSRAECTDHQFLCVSMKM